MGEEFEWDRRKERLNRLKHGVGFEEAITVFEDSNALGIRDDAHSGDEERYITSGTRLRGGSSWSAIPTGTTASASSAPGGRRLGNGDIMKNHDDDMAPEYDFSHGVRGRYAGRFYVDPATPAGTTVVLRRAIPEHALQAGDAGRLVGAEGESALRVEFTFGAGQDTIQVDLRPGDLRLLGADEVLHARRTRAG